MILRVFFLSLGLHIFWTSSAPTTLLEVDDDDTPPPKKLCVKPPCPRCRIVISEIKFDPVDITRGLAPYIELQVTCHKRPGPVPKNMLQHYNVFLVDITHMSSLLSIDLSEFNLVDNKKYIVLGFSKSKYVDIELNSPHTPSTLRIDDFNNFNPSMLESMYGLIVTYSPQQSDSITLKPLKTSFGQWAKTSITSEGIRFLENYAVDMIVCGQNVNLDSTKKFNSIWNLHSKFHNQMFLSRWTEYENLPTGNSLSVCEEYEGFQSSAFIITKATPGADNNCNQFLQSISSSCYQGDHTYCAPMLEDVMKTTDATPTTSASNLRQIGSSLLTEMKNAKFNPVWVGRCSSNFPSRENPLLVTENQNWLRFDDDTRRFTCRVCKYYQELGFRNDYKRKPDIMTTGYLSKDIYGNSGRIKSHGRNPIHQEALQLFSAIRLSTNDKEVANSIREAEHKERAILKQTMNFLHMTYTELKAGLSFLQHEKLMRTLRLTSMDFGFHHHSPDGATNVATVLSDAFHRKLLNYLVDNRLPFSILVDGSSSFNQAFLAVYIQTLENGLPMSHFYALLHLSEGERGLAMAKAVMRKVNDDGMLVEGFPSFFKKNIAAVVSDGAANMVGIRNSFHTHLRSLVGKGIPKVVCLAHNLDNSFKKGMKVNKDDLENLNDCAYPDSVFIWQLKYFENFESATNEFYNFYASRGWKKWNHLLQTAGDLDMCPKTLKYLYAIRWSESHFNALDAIRHNYWAIVKDLQEMLKEEDFAKNVNTVQSLLKTITDKTYYLALHDILDVLEVYKIASKHFQESSATIVGQAEVVYGVLSTLESLCETPGKTLTTALQAVSCIPSCTLGTCSLDDFENCQQVDVGDKQLKHNFLAVMEYQDMREYLFRNLATSVKHYFRLRELEAFELFNPKAMNLFIDNKMSPIALDDLYILNPAIKYTTQLSTPLEQILELCKFYELSDANCRNFQVDWTLLMDCLLTTEAVQLNTVNDPSRFWAFAKTQCSSHWTDVTNMVVGNVMVLPFSSSIVERGFSAVNILRTKKRSTMNKDTLDTLLRIHTNGPDPSDLKVYEYTLEFVKKFVRVDDDTFRGGAKPTIERNALKSSQIY